MFSIKILHASGRCERMATGAPCVGVFNISALPHTCVSYTSCAERCRHASVHHDARRARRRTAHRAGVCTATSLVGDHR